MIAPSQHSVHRPAVAPLQPRVALRAGRHAPRRTAPPKTTTTTRAVAAPDATTLAYAALGASALGFVGTFGLAPIFKSSFKEDADWKQIFSQLQADGGVQFVDPAAAAAQSNRGQAVLLDVRLASKYEAGHAADCLSCPLYLPIQAWDVPSIIRRAGFAFFGIFGTELNTAFADEVAAKVPRSKQLILLCESGGSLENKSGTKFGFQSRSLKGVYFLRQAGFSKVAVVAGGLPAWAREGLEMAEGPEDLAAVKALSMPDEGEQQQARSTSPLEGVRELISGLKLPELSFLAPSRR